MPPRTYPLPHPAAAPIDLDKLPGSTLLDPVQTAQVLVTTPATLEVWRSTGRHALKYVKVGRRVRYRVADLRAWLDARTHLHTGDNQ